MKSIYKLIIILASLSVSSVFASTLGLYAIANKGTNTMTIRYHNYGGHFPDKVITLAPGEYVKDMHFIISDSAWGSSDGNYGIITSYPSSDGYLIGGEIVYSQSYNPRFKVNDQYGIRLDIYPSEWTGEAWATIDFYAPDHIEWHPHY